MMESKFDELKNAFIRKTKDILISITDEETKTLFAEELAKLKVEIKMKMDVITSQNKMLPLHKKSPYSELFWPAFFVHFSAFGLNTESPYSVRMRKMREKCGPE